LVVVFAGCSLPFVASPSIFRRVHRHVSAAERGFILIPLQPRIESDGQSGLEGPLRSKALQVGNPTDTHVMLVAYSTSEQRIVNILQGRFGGSATFCSNFYTSRGLPFKAKSITA